MIQPFFIIGEFGILPCKALLTLKSRSEDQGFVMFSQKLKPSQ